MRKLSIILLSTLFCAAAFFVPQAQAQVTTGNVTFTVQLSGEGARLGRLILNHWPHGASEPVSLGECPFWLVEGQSSYPLLSSDQLSCTFTVPSGSFIMVGAKAANLQASDRDWTVGFSTWEGFCSGPGNYVEVDQSYYCEANIYQSSSLTANFTTVSGSPELATPTPTPTPTATPTMTPNPEVFLESESKDIGKSLTKFDLKKFSKGSSLKIKLGSAPASGKLSVKLTRKIKSKKAKKKAAFVTAPASILTLASAKATLVQGVAANLLLRPTAKGKTYMKGKSKVAATMTMKFVPSGGGDIATQVRNLLMKRR